MAPRGRAELALGAPVRKNATEKVAFVILKNAFIAYMGALFVRING